MTKTLGLMGSLLLFILSCVAPDHRDTGNTPVATDLAPSGNQDTSTRSDDELTVEATGEAQAAFFGGATTQATCTARCVNGSTASCTAPSCTAVDQNCGTGQPGYAECNGVRTFCAPCPCPEGATRSRAGSGCCCDGVDSSDHQQIITDVCINGAWIPQGSECSGPSCGGLCPI
jgi:hypothetical protein